MTKKRRKPGGGTRTLAAPTPTQTLTPTAIVRPIVGRQSPQPSIWRWNPYNNFTELSFDRIVSILKNAEQGFTEQLADLFIRMRSSDDHLYSVCETRVNAVAGAKWKVNPAVTEGAQAHVAEQAARDCEAMLRSVPNLRRVFRDILDGAFVGWSVLEIIWEPRGDEWVPAQLIWLHPRRFRFAEDFSLFLWDDGMAATQARELGAPVVESRGASGIALSPNKYVIHVPRPLQTYPMVSGILVPCIRPWWVKLATVKYWLAGAEVGGNPRYTATAPQATPDNVFEALRDELQGLAADGVAVFREGVTVDIQSPLAQGAGSVWSALYDNANAAQSKAVLGSTLNVEIGDTGGAYAAAESQSDITITPRILADADAMWETIARDIFRPYLWFNRHKYGGQMPPLPRGETVLFEPKPEVDDLLVRTKSVKRNELRAAKGLDPLLPEQGGDEFVTDVTAVPQAPPFPELAPQSDPLAPPTAATPLPDVAEGAPVEKAADAALNGAQVTSLLEIVQRVATNQIPRETGINLITAAFPLTREQAEQIMGSVGAGFTPAPEGGEAAAPLAVEAPAALPLRASQAPWEVALRMATSTTSRSLTSRATGGADATPTSTPLPTTPSGSEP